MLLLGAGDDFRHDAAQTIRVMLLVAPFFDVVQALLFPPPDSRALGWSQVLLDTITRLSGGPRLPTLFALLHPPYRVSHHLAVVAVVSRLDLPADESGHLG